MQAVTIVRRGTNCDFHQAGNIHTIVSMDIVAGTSVITMRVILIHTIVCMGIAAGVGVIIKQVVVAPPCAAVLW